MKVIVFSDSHRDLREMYAAIEVEKPDQVIHLGDHCQDAQEMAHAYPTLPFCMVAGNCDGCVNAPLVREIMLCNRHILLSHGHIWEVKRSYDAALAAAQKANADILLFGHTHKAYCTRTDAGIWVLNPGASRTNYGIILLENEQINCTLHLALTQTPQG